MQYFQIERLIAPDATVDDVFEYLRYQHAERVVIAGADCMLPEQFFNGASDLEQFNNALAWWPRFQELPAQLAHPTLYTLCFNYWDAHPSIGVTFMDRLMKRSKPVVQWLIENGYDPTNPQVETTAQRKVRKNREAQRRYRLRRDGQFSAAVLAAETALNAIKKERETVLKSYDKEIAEKHAEFMALCAQRKERQADLNMRVLAAREALKAAKKNPPPDATPVEG